MRRQLDEYIENNIITKVKNEKKQNRLLIQYSEGYDGEKVNVFHRWLTIEK